MDASDYTLPESPPAIVAPDSGEKSFSLPDGTIVYYTETTDASGKVRRQVTRVVEPKRPKTTET